MIAIQPLLIFLAAFGPADYLPLFERVFGDAVRLDPAKVQQVLNTQHGERHYFDITGDGRPNEVWYVCLSPRHPENTRPVLVRVIDEDGDLEWGGEPDLDSDLYVADWKADGVVDVVLDYTDFDGDGDVDQVGMYKPSYRRTDTPEIMVWWGLDIGDDNLLWYDVAYGYRQRECQTRSHFGGNEVFAAFTLSMDDAFWVPRWENPFAFYDHDGDTAAEEVVRIEAENYEVYNLRHSFDVDNNNSAENPRNFDVSISAHAPDAPTESILMTPGFLEGRGNGGMRFDPAIARCYTLRGIPTGPILDYYAAPGFALRETWADMLLTWNENDLNIDTAREPDGRFLDTQERWEGIIPPGTEGFHQIGGPHCGHYNKRYELRTTPGTIRVYFSPTDNRVHLHGAQRAWLIVDYEYDDKPDARYDYFDTNGDGYIDRWEFDADGDGVADDAWTAGDVPYTDLPYTWSAMHATVTPVLDSGLKDLFALVNALEHALAQSGATETDPISRFVRSGFDSPLLDTDLRERLIGSNQTWFYYLDVLKDRLIVQLKRAHPDGDFWAAFDALRATGSYERMRAHIAAKIPSADIGTAALSDLQSTLLKQLDRPHVAWAQDWVPPNIGWENEAVAYRAYWGQFDFFGKSRPGLILPEIAQAGDYHKEQDWGMDALHVGESCGLGGATLYVNDAAYPVYSPGGKGPIRWSKRLLSESPEAVRVELLAENVGPEDAPYVVRFVCSAIAEVEKQTEAFVFPDGAIGEVSRGARLKQRKDSPIEITVEGGRPDDAIKLGIGLVRLPNETFALETQRGVMAARGVQDPAIGPVSIAVIFPRTAYLRYAALREEHQVILRIERGAPLEYAIAGDWLNGRRFPRCPSLMDWVRELGG